MNRIVCNRLSSGSATIFSIVALGVIPVASAAAAAPPRVGPQVRIDPGGTTFAANETTASASEGRPDVIVAGWNDWRRSSGQEIINAGFSLSFDKGETWQDFLLRPPQGFQTTVEGDPMSAFDDRTGTLWGGAIAFGGSHLYVARLDPGSNTFNPSVVALSGGLDKCWMAAGPRMGEPNSTRVFITLNSGILWSDDMGNTWRSPISLGSGIGFLPRVGPDGEIYVAYWDFSNGMMLKRSLNNGASFTTHRIATRMDTWGTQDGSRFPGNFRVPPLAYIDVSMNTGKLYASYFDTTDMRNNGRNVDIYFTTSTDRGSTWSTPRVVNTDNDPPGDQFFSWIEVDSRDRIHMVFFDSRHTLQNDGVLDGMFDAYYMVSQDDGATWDEFRLTPKSWNSRNDGLPRGNSQFIGDYLGLATAGNRAYPVYTDTSAGDPDTFVNIVTFGEPATITAFDIVRGTLLDGDVTDLRNSDDNVVRVRSAVGRIISELHATEMIVHADSPVDSASSLEISVESRVDEPAGTLKVALRNWNSNEFDQVGAAPVGNTDGTDSFSVDDAADYISGNGEIDVSVKLIVFAPFLAFNFESFVDIVEVLVIE